MNKDVIFRKRAGRISLELHVMTLGEDLLIALTGGFSHIGASAFCRPGEESSLVSLPGHREDELARRVARIISHGLGRTVLVAAGIHYPGISRAEIAAVMGLSDSLVAECLATYQKNAL